MKHFKIFKPFENLSTYDFQFTLVHGACVCFFALTVFSALKRKTKL